MFGGIGECKMKIYKTKSYFLLVPLLWQEEKTIKSVFQFLLTAKCPRRMITLKHSYYARVIHAINDLPLSKKPWSPKTGHFCFLLLGKVGRYGTSFFPTLIIPALLAGSSRSNASTVTLDFWLIFWLNLTPGGLLRWNWLELNENEFGYLIYLAQDLKAEWYLVICWAIQCFIQNDILCISAAVGK